MEDLKDYQTLRHEHPGWCTIESEPAIFNDILRNAGVMNVRVKEVYSLDEEIVNDPRPIHGLIFLSRWREDDSKEMETNCPDAVWFANQISDNSCASLAMLNILFNSESVVLGEELAEFKSFTGLLTPPLRGLCLQNFEFLRRIHNSFARRSEIMQNNLDAIKACGINGKSTEEYSASSEPTYHFIAYVPACGYVWELDGLRRWPVNIGENTCPDRWLLTAMPRIQHRISRYSESELMFTLLALTNSTLTPRAILSPPTIHHQNDTHGIKWLRGDPEFAYATRVKHPYAAFMRRYVQILADKGLPVGV
ncbi:hypothetical protein TWF696_007086 [Orbilia brochopaga]|uniref:Ubiquitin carboxyl-terminal hydrolase n=1 Tax=Orbilia brochopaga TaxID=3140254 RepID=A0AAV9UUE4_9PEZI